MAAEGLSGTGRCEVEDVLAALRDLAGKVDHPTVRACLESAHDDIVHLVGAGKEDGPVADPEFA